MANQFTPKSQRAEPTVIKPVRWPASKWREVQRAARAAKTTESEFVRAAVERELARAGETT